MRKYFFLDSCGSNHGMSEFTLIKTSKPKIFMSVLHAVGEIVQVQFTGDKVRFVVCD